MVTAATTFSACKHLKGQQRCWRFDKKVIPFKKLLFCLLKFTFLPWAGPGKDQTLFVHVWVVKLEANSAPRLAFSYNLDDSVIQTSLLTVEDWPSLRTLEMLPAAWKSGETMQRATNFAVVRCVRVVRVTSFRDDFWTTFAPSRMYMFLFWFSAYAKHTLSDEEEL